MLKITSAVFVEKASFLIPKAKLVFAQLRQAFTKAPIPCYFDLKCYI